MIYKKIVPNIIKKQLKLILFTFKFPGRKIHSHLIGDYVQIGKECLINKEVSIGEGVKIGDYTYINRNTIISSGEIGKYCSVGSYCQIGLEEHPINYISTSPYVYEDIGSDVVEKWNHFKSPPIIGNDVWIGGQVTILQDVKVGNGAIIAAGAVVTKDVPDYSIVAGVPAKVIKMRFSEEDIETLQKMSWWDLSKDELEKKLSSLNKKWNKI